MINGNNSYAQNSSMNIRKDNDDWCRAVDTVDVSEVADLVDKTITENGTYVASDDGVSGYSSVSVDVSGTGTPVMATPTAVANAVNAAKRVITLKGGDYVRLPSGEGRTSPSGTQYYVFTTPISSFTFVDPGNVGDSAIVIFTCGENMEIKYYSSGYQDVRDNNSNIVANSMVAGKTYKLGVLFTNVQGTIKKVEAYSVVEYDEPITYSVQ